MSKRELLELASSKRYFRRDTRGRFTDDQSDTGHSLTIDRRTKAKRTVPKGQGDRGDQRKRSGS